MAGGEGKRIWQRKKKRTKRKKRSSTTDGGGAVLYAAVAVVLIAASLVAACTVFFRVESVTVEGNERYSTEEILSVASIEMGANMILTPSQQIADAIASALPYVDQVEVQQALSHHGEPGASPSASRWR